MRVDGIGKTPNPLMIIGEGPGWQEDRCGEPFVGKTGDEIDRHLEANNLPPREDWFLTNIYRYYGGKDYEFTQEDLARDEPSLLDELSRVQPDLIVPLGRHATRWILGDVDMDATWGIPWHVEICYGCARDGRKVLVTGPQDRHLLDMDRLQVVRVRKDVVADTSTSLHLGTRPNSSRYGSGPSLLQPCLRTPRSSRTSHQTREQPESNRSTLGVSMGTSVDTREYLSVSGGTAALPNVRPEAGEGAICSACGGQLSLSVCLPIHHPASALHNPDQACYVVSGFQRLAMFLNGQVEPRVLFDDPIKEPMYEEITSEFALEASLCRLKIGQVLSIDTEGWPHNPWSVQYSTELGIGYLIRATAPSLLKQFGEILCRVQPRLVYHSALHDIGMLRALGIGVEGLTFDDTMIQAYLLQIEPKGLKAACLRHCGMKMSDYSEIVAEPSERIARDYLTWLWDGEQHDYEEAQQAEFDRRRASGRRIRVLPKLPKTPLHKAVTRILQSKRSRGLWEDQIEDIHVAAYTRLGEMPEATLDFVEPTTAISYGCRDADGTIRLLPEYTRRLDAMGLRDVYNLERSTYPLLDRMQHIGIKPDLEHFKSLSTRLEGEIQGLQTRLCGTTGVSDFNANSGDQVAAYLFGTLGLDEVKMTKGGRGSTNDKILEALEHEHPEYPQISTIRAYRETYKLKHTFVDRIPDFVHRWPRDGRIHTTLRTTSVVTGRLAASDPNLLAQPEHGRFADDFKRGWVADEGHVLYSVDESQIEMRGLAHMSQDPVLCDAFRKGIDLHALLAQRIFGIKPKDQDKHKHRYPAKTIHYLMAMGGTAKGLQVQLRANGMFVSEDDAQRWLDETFGLYKGTRAFIVSCIEEARQHGFVRGLSGRVRYIGGIRSRDDRVREEAERFTYSFKIQESASMIMKRAEATIWEVVLPYFWSQGVYVEPLLQVHDSLRFECDEAVVGDLHTYVSDAMTNVPNSFSVPLAVEAEFGYNLADVTKIDA